MLVDASTRAILVISKVAKVLLRLGQSRPTGGKAQQDRGARISRSPCCVLLALSWNTNENLSTDKLSRAINQARIQSGGYILICSQRLASRLQRSAQIVYCDQLWKQFGWYRGALQCIGVDTGHILEEQVCYVWERLLPIKFKMTDMKRLHGNYST